VLGVADGLRAAPIFPGGANAAKEPIAGNLVHAAGATPLVVINQIKPILVRFAVPGSELPLVRRYSAVGTVPVTAVLTAPPARAIVEAASVRFRPIMMTTMPALMAAIPIALGWGAGAGSRRPLGVAVVGGLARPAGRRAGGAGGELTHRVGPARFIGMNFDQEGRTVTTKTAERIHWRTDVDAALDEARSRGRHVLLDFSAAPM
jgi:hypothetical protein